MMSDEMFRKLGIVSLTTLLIGMAGCNTVEGIGEDVEAAGEEIEEEAEEF